MTPAARHQAAIEILETWAPGRPMDRILVQWGRANRYAGSGDRAAIADLVYAALRRWRSLGWPEEGAPAPARARLLALAAEAGDPGEIFDGSRHAPAPPTADERAWLAARAQALAEAPEGVRLDAPDWLLPELRASLGPDLPEVMAALQDRAPVDLRVNRLKATPEAARAALADAGVETEPVPLGPPLAPPLAPDALRVTGGARRLRRSAPFRHGWVELQDAASQAAALFAGARPGARVLDFCAGGGGKALALASAMGGEGEIVAHDADPGRMADLPARAARAGASIRILPGPLPAEMEGSFDLVFADAPCSGSGAWRRNPDAKWGFSAEALDRLRAQQAEVISAAARFVRPGGRLIYATCSLLEVENRGALAAAPREAAEELRLTPLQGGDGFYAARLKHA